MLHDTPICTLHTAASASLPCELHLSFLSPFISRSSRLFSQLAQPQTRSCPVRAPKAAFNHMQLQLQTHVKYPNSTPHACLLERDDKATPNACSNPSESHCFLPSPRMQKYIAEGSQNTGRTGSQQNRTVLHRIQRSRLL